MHIYGQDSLNPRWSERTMRYLDTGLVANQQCFCIHLHEWSRVPSLMNSREIFSCHYLDQHNIIQMQFIRLINFKVIKTVPFDSLCESTHFTDCSYTIFLARVHSNTGELVRSGCSVREEDLCVSVRAKGVSCGLRSGQKVEFFHSSFSKLCLCGHWYKLWGTGCVVCPVLHVVLIPDVPATSTTN